MRDMTQEYDCVTGDFSNAQYGSTIGIRDVSGNDAVVFNDGALIGIATRPAYANDYASQFIMLDEVTALALIEVLNEMVERTY